MSNRNPRKRLRNPQSRSFILETIKYKQHKAHALTLMKIYKKPQMMSLDLVFLWNVILL